MEQGADPASLDRRACEDLRRLVERLAHHIRSPLSTIKSGLQLIQLHTKRDDDNATFIDSMLAEVSRIDDALRGAQQYADLDVGPARPVAVAHLVARGLDGRSAAGLPGEASATVAPGPLCSVLGDPEQLSLALAELIANAARVSPPGAPVTVGWGPPEGGVVRIHVDDEGPGVAPANVDRILQPYFSSSPGHLGLGLNIVQTICRQSGGRLEWCNHAGAGCRFTLVLREV